MQPGKVFVGGLTRDTNDEMFKRAFTVFGEVIDVMIMRHRDTGVSRGFGFVTFKDKVSADKVVTEGVTIDNRQVECKHATPKVPQSQMGGGRTQGNKIFVGGLATETTEQEFKTYFEPFGAVLDVTIMTDRSNGRSRGFGFCTFEDPSAVEQILKSANHSIGGKLVECKLAVPRDVMGGGGGGGGPPGPGGYGGPPPPFYGYGRPPPPFYPPYGYGYPPPPAYGYGYGARGYGAEAYGAPGAQGYGQQPQAQGGYGGAAPKTEGYGAQRGYEQAGYPAPAYGAAAAAPVASAYDAYSSAAPAAGAYGPSHGHPARGAARSDRQYHPYR